MAAAMAKSGQHQNTMPELIINPWGYYTKHILTYIRKRRRASQTSTLTARNECLDVANVQQFWQFLFKFLSWNLIDHLKLTVFALEHKVKQEINIEFYSNKFRTGNGFLRCKHAKHDLYKIVESLWPNTIFFKLSSDLQVTFHSTSKPFPVSCISNLL